jgi:hypothetical protein
MTCINDSLAFTTAYVDACHRSVNARHCSKLTHDVDAHQSTHIQAVYACRRCTPSIHAVVVSVGTFDKCSEEFGTDGQLYKIKAYLGTYGATIGHVFLPNRQKTTYLEISRKLRFLFEQVHELQWLKFLVCSSCDNFKPHLVLISAGINCQI